VYDVADAKRALRVEARTRRKARPADGAAMRVRDRVLESVPIGPGAVVGGYWPLDDELDVRPLLEALARRGNPCALPVVLARGRPLGFRRWKPGDALERAGFGLSHPPARAPELDPDVLLVPLIAFDDRSMRLGYGGGFYDRTIAALRARRKLLTVGVGFALQEVPHVPTEAHDIALDWIVTEREARRRGQPA